MTKNGFNYVICRYKFKKSIPRDGYDLSRVIDLRCLHAHPPKSEAMHIAEQSASRNTSIPDMGEAKSGLWLHRGGDVVEHAIPSDSAELVASSARLFSFKRVDGLYFISQALTRSMQIEFCHKCLTNYCKAPNITNLSKIPLEDVDFQKLSWSTVGLHFDWDTRKYRQSLPSYNRGKVSQNMEGQFFRLKISIYTLCPLCTFP